MKFALIHHSACAAKAFHYIVERNGERSVGLPESARGAHTRSIAICLEGDFESESPTAAQLNTLRALLLDIKLRYPDIKVGGHRQVRGETTDCPGARFPLQALQAWSRTGLLEERDAALTALIERQYGP